MKRIPRLRPRLAPTIAALCVAGLAMPLAAAPDPNAEFTHIQPVTALAFTPDGNALATAAEGKVLLWDIAARKVDGTFPDKPPSPISSLAISPDGRTLASGHLDKVIRLWNASTGKLLHELAGSQECVTNVRFSPNGKLLASGGPEAAVRLWDPNTGKELRTFTRNSRWHIGTVLFSPDSQRVIAGGYDGTVRTWSADSGAELSSLPAPQFTCLTLTLDGHMIAMAGRDNTIALLEVASGKMRAQFGRHGGMDVSVEFSPSGRWLIGRGKQENRIYVWSVLEGKQVMQLQGEGRFLFSPCGRYLTLGRGNKVCLWQTADLLKDHHPEARRLTQGEMEQAWEQLADGDPATAWEAVTAFALGGNAAAEFLHARTRPSSSLTKAADSAKLIADLDADSHKVREQATAALAAMGKTVEPRLRAALDAKPSLEVRSRIELILEKLGGTSLSSDELRLVRAAEAMELIRGAAVAAAPKFPSPVPSSPRRP